MCYFQCNWLTLRHRVFNGHKWCNESHTVCNASTCWTYQTNNHVADNDMTPYCWNSYWYHPVVFSLHVWSVRCKTDAWHYRHDTAIWHDWSCTQTHAYCHCLHHITVGRQLLAKPSYHPTFNSLQLITLLFYMGCDQLAGWCWMSLQACWEFHGLLSLLKPGGSGQWLWKVLVQTPIQHGK